MPSNNREISPGFSVFEQVYADNFHHVLVANPISVLDVQKNLNAVIMAGNQRDIPMAVMYSNLLVLASVAYEKAKKSDDPDLIREFETFLKGYWEMLGILLGTIVPAKTARSIVQSDNLSESMTPAGPVDSEAVIPNVTNAKAETSDIYDGIGVSNEVYRLLRRNNITTLEQLEAITQGKIKIKRLRREDIEKLGLELEKRERRELAKWKAWIT